MAILAFAIPCTPLQHPPPIHDVLIDEQLGLSAVHGADLVAVVVAVHHGVGVGQEGGGVMALAIAASLLTQGDVFQGSKHGSFFLQLLVAFNVHAGFTVLCDDKGLSSHS